MNDPTPHELRAMVATIRGGGSIGGGAILLDEDDFDQSISWNLAVVRYVNRLGPDVGHDREYQAVVEAHA